MSSSFWRLTATKGRGGTVEKPCPQSAQSETLYVKFCYPVRVVNKCNRMPSSYLLSADPTGPLQSIVVVALAAAGALPSLLPPFAAVALESQESFLGCYSCCCGRYWRQEVILPTASSAAYVWVAVVVAVLLLLPTLLLLLFVFVSVCLHSCLCWTALMAPIVVDDDTLQPLPVAVRLQVI